ncbi:hypothetical protein PHYSODRAFT_342221, partial [Phytophthora sojae]
GQDAPSSSTGSDQTSTTTPLPPPRYQSSVDFNSSFESRKRKSPEKLCAPDSADGPPVKARGNDTGNRFTAAEMRYMLAGVELIRLLEHDPILRFIKPNATKFTGPFRVPDFEMLTNVTRAAGTLFEMLHESGFSLGITERTGVYDWDVESWTRTIRGVLGPLTVLVGSIQRKVTPPGTGPIATQMITSSQAESSVHSTSRSKPRRDVDGEPTDLFDVDFGMPKTTAATSTTTSPEPDEVFNHLSEPPRATPREVTPARIKVLPDLKEAIPKALGEASTRSTITQASNTHVSAVHVEPRNSTRKNLTQKMSARDASKEMRQQGLGNHAVMSVAVPVATTSRRPLGTARASTTPEQSRYNARVRPVSLDALKQLDPGQTLDVRLRSSRDAPRLWVTRRTTWVTTMFKTKIERQTYLRVTNVTDETITLDAGTNVGWWAPSDVFPPAPRFVLATNRQYQDWQNLAYEVTCDEDETWREDELVWPMYGWPTYEDLEFDARRAVETSSVSKLQTRGHSTLSRVVLKTRVDVVTTCVLSDHGSQRSDNAGRPVEASRVEQPVEGASGDEARGAPSSGRSQQCDGVRQSSERAQVAKSNRDKCDSVRCEGWNVSEPSQKQSQKCDTVRWTECDTVRQSSEGSRGRDDVRLTECDTMRRSVARSQTCDGMRLGDKAGKWRLWRHSALEPVKNKPNVNFDVVDEGPDGGRTGGPPGSAPKERHRAINLDRLVNPEQDAGPNCAMYRSGGYAAAGRVVRFPVDKPECHGAPPGGLLAKVPAVTRRVSSELNKSAVLKMAGKAGDEPRSLQLHRLRICDALHVQPRYGVRRGGNTGPDALVGCVRRDQEDSATNNSSQIRCAETMHRREVTGESDPGERGQRSAAAGCTGAMHRAKDGADSAKTQVGVIQPTTAQNASSPSATRMSEVLNRVTDSHANVRRGAMGSGPNAARAQAVGIQSAAARTAWSLSATRMPEVLHCAMDSHAEARRGAMDSGLGAARMQAAGNEPAATRNASSPIRRPVAVSKYVEGPTSVQPSECDDAINRNPPCVKADWEFEVARSVSDAASDSSRDGTESTRRGICILQNCRLAQVNVLVVGQAGDDADRTRGDVAAMNRAGNGICLRARAHARRCAARPPFVSTYAVRLETGCTPCQFSVKDVSKLRPVCAMINGAAPSNEPADCSDEMPLEASRDTSTVKSDGVAYSKVRDKHAETVRVVIRGVRQG